MTKADRRYQDRIDAFNADPARATEFLRPQYHFTPVAGFFNDPNGMTYFNGKWEYFYQHNGWGHAKSDDLVYWEHRKMVAYPDRKGLIWSGSGVVDQKDTSGLFGGKPGYVGIFTYKNDREGGRQSQALVISPDGDTFRKYEGNPVIPQLRHIEGQPDDPKFRDPKVFWHEPTQRWVMCVAGGLVRFFSSENLIDWQFESINEDINVECPDLFELPVDGDEENKMWVLNGGGTFYILGEFDGKKFTPKSERLPISGGRDFYASQTFDGAPDGRRIMSTWMFNWANKGWIGRKGGAMTLFTVLSLRTTPEGVRLFQEPVEELNVLRHSEAYESLGAFTGTKDLEVSGNQLELNIVLEPGSAQRSGVHVLQGRNGEQTTIGYDAERGEVYLDPRQCGYSLGNMWDKVMRFKAQPIDGKITLRIYIDWSTVEVFVNGGAGMVNSVVAPQPLSTGVQAFAEDGEVSGMSVKSYHMKTIWRDEDESGDEPERLHMLPAIVAPIGKPTYLAARIWPATAKDRVVEWSSSDESIVKVSPDGSTGYAVLEPVGFGIAKVTARTRSGGLVKECEVLVQQPDAFISNAKVSPPNTEWLYIAEGLSFNGQSGEVVHYKGGPSKHGAVDVTLRKEGRASLLVHGSGRGSNGHYIEIDSEKDTVSLVYRRNRKVERLQTMEREITVGQTYRIAADLDGNDPFALKAYLDGEVVFEAKNLTPAITWARDIGFRSDGGAQAVFNNFEIK